jgi:iron-only hydrogenase group A
MANQVNLKINGMPVTVDENTTIMEAAKKLDIHIPTLCYHKDLCIAGNCRVCIVEQKGSNKLPASCAVPVFEGMEIETNTLKVRQARKHIIELLLSEHNTDCTSCYKNGNCELQNLAAEFMVDGSTFMDLVPGQNYQVDSYSPSIIRDDSKCVRCGRCVRTCEEMQKVSALTMAFKGAAMKVCTFRDNNMLEVVCTNCGQCVNRCPVGALTEKTYIDKVWDAIADPNTHVLVQTAPAVRVGLGEDLGLESGSIVTGQMAAALRRLGFDSVLDTNFTADLTIMEEGTELLLRLKGALLDKDPNAVLPMTTSCSPGWVKFIEHKYPELLPNVSTCKSPQQMFGALAKTYYPMKKNIDPAKMVSVSIMPCTAKKHEANRPEMRDSGFQDVDFVLTTRELAVMIKQAGLDFKKLPVEHFDSIMGEGTGAAVIFGATGGVMEAALRTAYEIVTGRPVPFENLEITPLRGMEGIKEATVKIEGCVPEWSFLEGADLKVAIAHGLVNADKAMKMVAEGNPHGWLFIEVMACPSGCIGGGGQPIPTNIEIRQARMDAIYQEDRNLPKHKSHENSEVTAIYKEFLTDGPCGHKSHELLHTHYIERMPY